MSTHFNGEPLFFEKAPIVKLARTKLGDDPKQWESDILEVLHQQHPYMLDTNISINMKKVDAESGTGIGAIVLDGKINVPIVIHNYRMAPLDVFLNDTEVVPLTRERIERAMKTLAIGKPVTPSKGEATDSSITHMTTPPYDGKYTFASNLSYTKAEFASAINHTFNETGFVLDIANNDLWKEALNSYLTSALEQEKTAQTGPKYFLEEKAPFQHQLTKEAGIYSVPTSKGDKVGVLVPITEKLASSTDRWLFVSLDGGYIPLADPTIPFKPVEHVKVARKEPVSGSGIFVANNGKLQATEIFDVICKLGSGDVLLKDIHGRECRMVKSANVDRIQMGGGLLVVPENYMFLPTTERLSLTHVKVANLLEDGSDRITVRNQNSRLLFSSGKLWEFGDLLSKEGSYPDEVLNALSPYFDDQSLQLLLTIPTGQQRTFTVKTAGIDKTASADVAVPVISRESIAAINQAAAVIDRKAAGFLKIAANEASETVDTLLGLNFLNKSNLHKFVENMDKVGEARQIVGQLLIASRLGLDVDDAPLRTAFFALDEVEQDLQQLYNVTTVNN
jgi:hypothetical protein